MHRDHDLLEAWASGDRTAGRALFERYGDRITRFFVRKVPPHDAADLVQRTFEKALAAGRRNPAIDHLAGWLFAVARNVLYDHLRQRRRHEGHEPARTSLAVSQTAPSGALARHEAQRRLLAGLLTLSLEEQLALELFYWEDLPMAQVAVALGVTRSAAINRVHRARNRLRDTLAEQARDAMTDPGIGFTTWARSLKT